ncbi:MAG TPA: hypothetical protein DEG71_03785 [Clostridiales bacterium]|nr:hypothetical protein [Clostridiales bacterium]
MNTEYEIRIIEVDVDKVVRRLEELGAEKVGVYDFRRYTYDIIQEKVDTWQGLGQMVKRQR